MLIGRAPGWLVLLGLALAGCAKPSSGGSSASASATVSAAPVAAPQLVTSEPLGSATAFELVVRDGGLRLLWATPDATDWLRSSDLAQDGRATLPARKLLVNKRGLDKVTDLTAVSLGRELVLAWIEQGKTEARAAGAVGTFTSSSNALDLGPAALSAESARGNIVLVGEPAQERARVMWRGLEAPCVDPKSSSPCVGFAFRRIQQDLVWPTGLPLSVPVPCTSHSALLGVSAGRFHYGVCTREGTEPVTTMFSIQEEPMYARAEPLLKGCLPLGTIDVGGEPWLVADCHGKRKAAKVPLADEKVPTEVVDALQISCTPERAELRQGRFVLPLREPRADLQAILPPSLVPTGARAGWTGKSLVVAYLAGSRLETRAYGCRGGTLQPL
jgi:hypothetical protein